ncbi:hypothetical protein Q7P35_009907 [Cladosporium inversicolor]
MRFADGGLPLALSLTIPADLVGDHEPKLGRRASATGSGCPGAVCFQVVGVDLLPCIDDVQDREIDLHRREAWRHSLAYAASVSFVPILITKYDILAYEASSFPRCHDATLSDGQPLCIHLQRSPRLIAF